jgi:hypothetical protein
MDVSLEHLVECFIDEAMPLDSAKSGKSRRNEIYPEMPHSGGRPGVTGMKVTLVDNFQMFRLEGSCEYLFNSGSAVHVGISPCSKSASSPVDS